MTTPARQAGSAPGRASSKRAETASVIRDLIHALASADADDGSLEQVAVLVRSALDVLGPAPRRRRDFPDFANLSAIGDAGMDLTDHAMADRAVAGPANPASVDITTQQVGDEALATVRFGAAFEGAPGRVHGGLIAAVFDDLTNYALAIIQEPGFTGRLTVNFRRPIPIETPVEFRARIRERDGRKLYIEADATIDDETLATAEALFILVDREQFLAPATEQLG